MERSNGRAGPPARTRSFQHATHGRIGRTALRRDIRAKSNPQTLVQNQPRGARGKRGKTIPISLFVFLELPVVGSCFSVLASSHLHESGETKIKTDSRTHRGRAARLARRPGGSGRAPA